jgi:hypothetical protein
LLLAEETDELAASDRPDAESETTDAADLTLLDAFSRTPGSDLTIDEDALAERLLAPLVATDTTLSTLPWGVPMTELETWSAILAADSWRTDAMLSALPWEVPMTELEARSTMLLAEAFTTDVTLSTLPCWVPMIELDAWSARLLALALPTERRLSTLPCGVPTMLEEIDDAMLLALLLTSLAMLWPFDACEAAIDEAEEIASWMVEPATEVKDSIVPW